MFLGILSGLFSECFFLFLSFFLVIFELFFDKINVNPKIYSEMNDHNLFSLLSPLAVTRTRKTTKWILFEKNISMKMSCTFTFRSDRL